MSHATLRGSSESEYARWYLLREASKSSSEFAPAMPPDPLAEMRQYHPGKMRDWFTASTSWHLVSLDDIAEMANLVFLECPWTVSEGLVVRDGANYRLLDRVATNAMSCGYLDRPSAHKHRDYYDQLATGYLELKDQNRIAICSAEPSEIAANPAAHFYLLDGVGRCLPYMILLKEGRLRHNSIEAFLAERVSARNVSLESRTTTDCSSQ